MLMISGFRHKVYENVLFLVITQQVVFISHRRFGTTYLSVLSSRVKNVRNYHYLLHNNPEECSSFLL
jgi:hypothetical protein